MEDQYPRWKYGADGASLIVNNADEEEALGDVWHDSPADVPDPNDDPSKENAADLEVLRNKAAALGIKVDARWGEKRLAKEIAAVKDV